MQDIYADVEVSLGCLVMGSTRHPIRRADMGTFRLARQVGLAPDDVDLQCVTVQRIVPSLTEEEFDRLTPEKVSEIINRSLIGIAEANDLVGESSGAGQGSSGSPPAMPTPTSAIASPNGTD